MIPTNNDIPHGYCHCGCGQKTNLARCTDPQKGWTKGEPLRYLRYHRGRIISEPPNPTGLCQCGCGEKAPIAKRNNSEYGYVKGEPVRFIIGHHSRLRHTPIEERFWPKVNKHGPLHPKLRTRCWEWTAGGDQHGYGQIGTAKHKKIKAHRYSYQLHYGVELTSTQFVLHHCDNPSCVNPAHLFLGDQRANMADAARKGRTSPPPRNNVRGMRHGKAQLTNQDVVEIRAAHRNGATMSALAARFNVSKPNIHAIVHRRSWKHIP